MNVVTKTLVPVFDETVPTCRSNLARFMRVPENVNANIVMSFPLLVQFSSLPVPHIYFT